MASAGIDKEIVIKRAALKSAKIEAPYILCPHSMSGIEALYWAQQYPEEVLAIIGLDMAHFQRTRKNFIEQFFTGAQLP